MKGRDNWGNDFCLPLEKYRASNIDEKCSIPSYLLWNLQRAWLLVVWLHNAHISDHYKTLFIKTSTSKLSMLYICVVMWNSSVRKMSITEHTEGISQTCGRLKDQSGLCFVLKLDIWPLILMDVLIDKILRNCCSEQ